MGIFFASTRRLSRWADAAAGAGGVLASVCMILITGLILVEILLRAIWHRSTMIADEYSAYFFVGLVLLGLAQTLRDRAHIRITLLLGVLTGKIRTAVECLACLSAAVLTGYAFYHAVIMVRDTRALGMQADSISETPVWIPQLVIPVGLLLFLLQILAGLLRILTSSPNRKNADFAN